MTQDATTPRIRRLLTLLGVLAALGALPVLTVGCWTRMPGESSGGPRALDPLERDVAARLEAHVRKLCELAPRDDTNPSNYITAAAYLTAELESYGYEVEAIPPERGFGDSLLARLPAAADGPVVVVGAHYDSYGPTPGADDNASGVAATLELARLMAADPVARHVAFALFSNEEPPPFHAPSMGSLAVARELARREADVRVMFSLEMLGYYDDAPGSQHYPPVLSWFYPDTGDFIAFVTRSEDRAFAAESVATWRREVDFPSEGFAGPSFITGVDFSDHWSFWQAGYPAVMITDTAFFRNAHYHQPTDTPDTLDYPRFARVTVGVRRVVEMWARR
jgi:hypothetical protein